MDIVILGSGGPRPHRDRAGPAQAVLSGEAVHLVDCGPGAGHNLALRGVSLSRVSHVLLTHTHLDHCLELPAVVLAGYLEGRQAPIHIYGPEGTAAVVDALFNAAYDYMYRLVRDVTGVDVDIRVSEVSTGSEIQLGALTVTVAEVVHNFPCVAFRVEDTAGSSVTFSGDTVPCDAIVQLARGTDLLIHDCAFPDGMATAARASFHTSPAELGEVASAAGAGHVVATHMFPACDGLENEMAESIRRQFAGAVDISRDGQHFTLL